MTQLPHQGPLITSPEHHAWLTEQAISLLDFARNCIVPGRGAGWLKADGEVDLSQAVHTWITCRMAHSYSIGAFMGVDGAHDIAEQAIAALLGPLKDHEYGGWFASIPAVPDETSNGTGGVDASTDTTKSAYAHAFVVLAATSGVRAGITGATELLRDALDVFHARFFDSETGLLVDEYNHDFSQLSVYRGVNANMHAVEALLAVGDVTGERKYHEEALAIAKVVALSWAPSQAWRIPEHFDAQWTPLLEFNAEKPDDQFKPYGATVGHGIEWARLLLHLDATFGHGTYPWLVESARQLYSRAITDGWRTSESGATGFVYTTNWQGTPVVETRMHWVAAEALASASALFSATGSTQYAIDYEKWLTHIRENFLDTELGSWHHELDTNNTPDDKVWPGKPDIYHALGALLGPIYPLSPSLTSAVAGK